jgi:hypothetical protein
MVIVLPLRVVDKLGQIIQGIAVKMLGGSKQNMLDEQRGATLLRQGANSGIAGRGQRNADAFVRQAGQERHALAVTFAENALIKVEVSTLPGCSCGP